VARVAHVAGAQAAQMFAGHDADVGEAGGAVAAGTVARVSGVINARRFPGCNGVASIAGLGGRDVGRRALPRRQGAVVAGRTHGNAGLRMIKLGDRLPLRREFVVAGIA